MEQTRGMAAVVGVLSLAVFMSSLDLFIVNLAFPYIGREYHGTTLSSLSWVLNGYSIVYAAVLIPAGRYADRVGRRRLFVAGLVLFSVTSLGCGLAPGVPALIAARLVQAVGAGLMVPASLSLLLAVCPPLVALALVEAPTWGWGSGRFFGLLVVAGASGAALVWRCRHHPSPVIELGLLRSRSFSGTLVASVLYHAALGAFVLNSVEFLTGVWHYSAVRAGLAMGPGPLMVPLCARVVAPRLAARIGGPGRVAVIGCLLNAGGQGLWLILIQAHPAYASHMLPTQLIGGVGVGLTIPSMLAAGSAKLTPARFGTGSGILNMARQVGGVLGVAGLVAILAHPDAADPVATFRHGVVLIVSFFGGERWRRPSRGRRERYRRPGGGLG